MTCWGLPHQAREGHEAQWGYSAGSLAQVLAPAAGTTDQAISAAFSPADPAPSPPVSLLLKETGPSLYLACSPKGRVSHCLLASAFLLLVETGFLTFSANTTALLMPWSLSSFEGFLQFYFTFIDLVGGTHANSKAHACWSGFIPSAVVSRGLNSGRQLCAALRVHPLNPQPFLWPLSFEHQVLGQGHSWQ